MILTDNVQITADNADVFNGRIGENPPRWAKRGRFQLIASDADWTFSFSWDGVEYARDSAPHLCEADNLGRNDFRKSHIVFPIAAGARAGGPLANINVVTAGVGLACLQYES